MKMNTLIIIQLILFSLISCEKKDIENDFPISLTYELLDSLKNPKTSFRYGEEIIFCFNITNNSDSLLYYETNFLGEEFFKVYKINNGVKTAVGKSYKGVFCTYIPHPEFFVLPHSISGVAIPWSPDINKNCYYPFCNLVSNPPLEKGEFFTGFSSKFKFFTKNKEIEYVSDLKTFTIKFKIE